MGPDGRDPRHGAVGGAENVFDRSEHLSLILKIIAVDADGAH